MNRVRALACAFLVVSGCHRASSQHHAMAAYQGLAPPEVSGVNFNVQQTANVPTPGSLGIQNVMGTLKQINDQGVVTNVIGGGGGGSSSSLIAGASPVSSNDIVQFITDPNWLSRGLLAVNFPAGTTSSAFEFPGTGSVHETSTLNVWAPSVQQPNSGALTQWRPDSSGIAQYTGHIAWAYAAGQNTHGNISTYGEIEVMSQGAPVDAMLIYARGDGTTQVNIPMGSVASPALTIGPNVFSGNTGFYGAAGDTNISLSLANAAVSSTWVQSTAVAGNSQTATGDYEYHVNGGTSGGGESRVTLGPVANHGGLYYDHIQGGYYVFAPASQFGIGPPGALATTATSGMLAMATMPGKPSNAPINVETGKSTCVIDTTDFELCCYYPAATAWKCTAAMN